MIITCGSKKKKNRGFKGNFLLGRGYKEKQQKQRLLDIENWKSKMKK
jgi:hypothetical protein